MTKITYRYSICKGVMYWCSGDEYDSDNRSNTLEDEICYIRGEQKSVGGPPPWCRTAEDRRAHEEHRAFLAQQEVLYAERRARKRKKRIQERRLKASQTNTKPKDSDDVTTTEEESLPSNIS